MNLLERFLLQKKYFIDLPIWNTFCDKDIHSSLLFVSCLFFLFSLNSRTKGFTINGIWFYAMMPRRTISKCTFPIKYFAELLATNSRCMKSAPCCYSLAKHVLIVFARLIWNLHFVPSFSRIISDLKRSVRLTFFSTNAKLCVYPSNANGFVWYVLGHLMSSFAYNGCCSIDLFASTLAQTRTFDGKENKHRAYHYWQLVFQNLVDFTWNLHEICWISWNLPDFMKSARFHECELLGDHQV